MFHSGPMYLAFISNRLPKVKVLFEGERKIAYCLFNVKNPRTENKPFQVKSVLPTSARCPRFKTWSSEVVLFSTKREFFNF